MWVRKLGGSEMGRVGLFVSILFNLPFESNRGGMRKVIACDERGMALIDAFVAAIILMLAFLPLSGLLISSTAVVGDYQATVGAASLGSGLLDQVRASDTSWTTASGAPSVLTLPTNGSSVVGSLSYNYSFSAGWCAVVGSQLSNGTPTNPTNPYVYYVNVHLTWFLTSGVPGHLDIASEISTIGISGVVPPSSATTPSDATGCPA